MKINFRSEVNSTPNDLFFLSLFFSGNVMDNSDSYQDKCLQKAILVRLSVVTGPTFVIELLLPDSLLQILANSKEAKLFQPID